MHGVCLTPIACFSLIYLDCHTDRGLLRFHTYSIALCVVRCISARQQSGGGGGGGGRGVDIIPGLFVFILHRNWKGLPQFALPDLFM